LFVGFATEFHKNNKRGARQRGKKEPFFNHFVFLFRSLLKDLLLDRKYTAKKLKAPLQNHFLKHQIH
jgi:hypothetical protein